MLPRSSFLDSFCLADDSDTIEENGRTCGSLGVSEYEPCLEIRSFAHSAAQKLRQMAGQTRSSMPAVPSVRIRVPKFLRLTYNFQGSRGKLAEI
jgi:hypothetical protein